MERYMPKILLSIMLAFASAAGAQAQAPSPYVEANPAHIHMVVWRGCEEACRGFIRDFEERDAPVHIEVTDVARDSSRLPDVRAALLSQRPDLVVTWGTSVSRGILGTQEEFGEASALGDIPAVFMIVADPVGSDIIDSYDNIGRPMITGVRNRVPEHVQLNLIFEYFQPKRLGVINDPDEINSTLNTQKLRDLAQELNFELLELEYDVDAEGKIPPEQIPVAMAEMKKMGAEAVYVGSSSYNLEYRDVFVQAALDHGLPVFSGYEKMVSEAGGLMAIANSYGNVGKLAAGQVREVLFEGSAPGDLPVRSLEHFSIFINLDTAKKLDRYPPFKLLNVAQITR
jgi:putative ABC transport system substrate-binding protein|tara:strand:+ start:3305 stop:4330 length:1026 start_codon:yes stop_codon:yes gene_type:complete